MRRLSGRGRAARTAAWAALAAAAVLAAGAAAAGSTKPQKWTGSRTTPVHRIPLKDELDQPIVPTESAPLPFSARTTCAPCHVYEDVRKGWHFNAASGGPAGRAGEPWVLLDERTGTQIPLSYRPWKGLRNPSALGLTAWDFTLLFGRHFPGGGPAEPDDREMLPGSRWNVSGKIEINCLGCHNASRRQDHSEWTKQVLRENFRWAATAAAGLGEVPGMASRLGPTWDVYDGPNPDDSEWAVSPSVKYDKTQFDSKHRAFLDLAYPPDDARCLACHSVAPAGLSKRDFDDDVHTAAGLKCAACHRNDVSHAMIRGYEGEGRDNPAAAGEDFTCRGCHMGGKAADGKEAAPGRMGAPRPLHKGLPQIHFDRVACTVCHSGPAPAEEPTRVRTARANRLGIFGVADWSTDLPGILEPVFVRGEDKKLAPRRILWPAFWAEIKGKDAAPLKPADVAAAAGDILTPEAPAVLFLNALAGLPEFDGTPVWVIGGRVFETNVDGGLSLVEIKREAAPKADGPALLKDGTIAPLIPDFDPADAEAAVEPELKIQKALEALAAAAGAPGKPVLIYKKFLYAIKDSAVDKQDLKGGAGAAGWGWLAGEKRIPLLPEFNIRTISALAGSDRTLTEEQVGLVLKKLAARAPAAKESLPGDGFAYIAGGKIFRLDKDGRLTAEDHDAAAPVTWPLAHQVRPARQALGVNGCTDCHTAGSNFFFAKVRAQSPLLTERAETRTATSFMGLTVPFHKLFGLSFTVRPLFKIVLAVCGLLIASVLAVLFLLTLGRASGLIEKRR